MKIKTACLGFAVCALGSTAAMAAQPGYPYNNDYGVYFGASAGELYYNQQGLAQMSPTIAEFRVGQQFNPYLAIEGRIGTNVSGGGAYGYHINSQAIYGAYIKGIYPFSPWVSAYGIAGLGGADWHRNYAQFDSNDIAISFGVGAEFNIGGNASLDLEWARLTSGTNDSYGYSADTLLFGVNWRLL